MNFHFLDKLYLLFAFQLARSDLKIFFVNPIRYIFNIVQAYLSPSKQAANKRLFSVIVSNQVFVKSEFFKKWR